MSFEKNKRKDQKLVLFVQLMCFLIHDEKGLKILGKFRKVLVFRKNLFPKIDIREKLFLFHEHVNMIKRVQTIATINLNSTNTDKHLGFQIKIQKCVHVLNNKHQIENEFTGVYKESPLRQHQERERQSSHGFVTQLHSHEFVTQLQ